MLSNGWKLPRMYVVCIFVQPVRERIETRMPVLSGLACMMMSCCCVPHLRMQ